MSDANDQLGPLFEGMVMAALDLKAMRQACHRMGASVELAELDRHSIVVTTESGRRWRLVFEQIEPVPVPKVPAAGFTKAAGW
jgi:hypothetical protein